MKKSKQKIVALASGRGRVLENLIRSCQSDDFPIQVVGVIGSRKGIGVLDLADRYGISHSVIDRRDYSNEKEWDSSLEKQLMKWGANWVLLSGFLKKIGPLVLRRFNGKIVNSHPSLLPHYGGQGMYGRKVHEAVIKAGEKKSGVTIHFVNENYDEGQIIAQKELCIHAFDTPETLEEKIIEMEKKFVTETLFSLCR